MNFKQKVANLKEKAAQKGRNAMCWISDNKDIAVPIITATLITAGKVFSVARDIARSNRVRRLERNQNSRVWDPVSGHFWYLKRPLYREEQLWFEQQLEKGVSRGRLLEDLGVLK